MTARHYRRNPDGTRTGVEHEGAERELGTVEFGEALVVERSTVYLAEQLLYRLQSDPDTPPLVLGSARSVLRYLEAQR